MDNTYIDIMLQSLKKKVAVLDSIEKANKKQREILEDSHSSIDDFDKTIAEKDKLIDQLDQLDSGFDKLYSRVEKELKQNTKAHADQVREMQGYIKQLTEKSVALQKQEADNKQLMTNRFTTVKRQAKSVRANAKATSQYYKNMMRANVVDPQFMDNKK